MTIIIYKFRYKKLRDDDFFRVEKLNLKSIHSQAKVLGTVTTVAGAMVMTLIKGPILELFWTKGRTYHEVATSGVDLHHSLKGAFMITVGCVSWSGFMILQVRVPINYGSISV